MKLNSKKLNGKHLHTSPKIPEVLFCPGSVIPMSLLPDLVWEQEGLNASIEELLQEKDCTAGSPPPESWGTGLQHPPSDIPFFAGVSCCKAWGRKGGEDVCLEPPAWGGGHGLALL